MATFTHLADCGVIGEQELTVTYEVEKGRAVISGVSLGNIPVAVSYTYMIHELYPACFAAESGNSEAAGEMREEMRRAA